MAVYDGVALDGVKVRVDNARILLGGATVARGYRNPISPDPFAEPGWFRTDDLGTVDDSGVLRVLGRVDDAVSTGGLTVLPQLVESALAGHPAIAECAVFGVPDERLGQRVVAALVLTPGSSAPMWPSCATTWRRPSMPPRRHERCTSSTSCPVAASASSTGARSPPVTRAELGRRPPNPSARQFSRRLGHDGDMRREVTSADELRAIVGQPTAAVAKKVTDRLSEAQQIWLKQSPLGFVATTDAHGRVDVSPKGDPPGFVQIIDDTTIAIPERPGNRRVDGFLNVLQRPHVGTVFVIPGRGDTLRINGTARILSDADYFDAMAVDGKRPILALEIAIEEVFFHCPKGIPAL